MSCGDVVNENYGCHTSGWREAKIFDEKYNNKSIYKNVWIIRRYAYGSDVEV